MRKTVMLTGMEMRRDELVSLGCADPLQINVGRLDMELRHQQ
jgi:hypothetical protein